MSLTRTVIFVPIGIIAQYDAVADSADPLVRPS